MKTSWLEEPKKLRLVKSIILPIYILTCALYLGWRFESTQLWNVWYAWPLFFSECIGILYAIFFLSFFKKILNPKKAPLLKGALVDVFIPTYNESKNIVMMTTIGALRIRGARNVFVLDDGKREEIKSMAQELGVKYVAREKHLHAKAGNLNSGLLYSDAEFIICLDCDHVPQPNFIEKTLGYFNDPKLAFVQTPQNFYNADSIQFRKTSVNEYWNEQTMFFDAIQPSKNIYNAAFFCGSGAILRRSALDMVGGFATETITEDIHTSIRLHAKGWSSVYLNLPLAHGLAADDLTEYYKQRVRWTEGGFSLLFRSKDSPLTIKGLTIKQRICYLLSMFSPLFGLQRLFYYLLPATILFVTPWSLSDAIVPAVNYIIIFIGFISFSYFTVYLFSNRTFRPFYTEQFNIANIFSTVTALKGIFNIEKVFSVSLKNKKKKDISALYYSLIFFLIFLIVANFIGLYGWMYVYGNSVASLEHNLLLIVFFWNNFNAVFIGSFVYFIYKHNIKPKEVHTLTLRNSGDFLSTYTKHVNVNKKIAIHTLGLEGASIFTHDKISSDNIIINIKNVMGNNILLTASVESSIHISNLNGKRFKSHILFTNLSQRRQVSLTAFLFHELVPQIFVVNSNMGVKNGLR